MHDERILERSQAGRDRDRRRAQQPHAVDVDLLPLDIGSAHGHHALPALLARPKTARYEYVAFLGYERDVKHFASMDYMVAPEFDTLAFDIWDR